MATCSYSSSKKRKRHLRLRSRRLSQSERASAELLTFSRNEKGIGPAGPSAVIQQAAEAAEVELELEVGAEAAGSSQCVFSARYSPSPARVQCR